MAFASGTAGSVAYVSGGTTSIVSAHEWSLDAEMKTSTVTAFGDQWDVNIPSIRSWKGSLGIRHDGSQASQDFIRNMILNGSAAITHRFSAGTNTYTGSALATGGKFDIAYDGAAETKYDLTGSGPLSYA